MIAAKAYIRPVSRLYFGLRWGSNRRSLLTLAIETSCDDTAVAILAKDTTHSRTISGHGTCVDQSSHGVNPSTHGPARLLFNERITARNTGHGGIHPIEALKSHEFNLAKLVQKSLDFLPSAEKTTPGRTVKLSDGQVKQLPDFVSVTRGPGMRSNLKCGLDTAKGLAIAWQVPLLGVHHMQAHALTPRLVNAMEDNIADKHRAQDSQPKFPFLTLLVSGGHTMLLHSRDLLNHQILATTGDVAVGDALDKCGRTILPQEITLSAKDTAFARDLSDFAFPTIESYSEWTVPTTRQDEISRPQNDYGWQMTTPLSNTRDLSFSFTSIASTAERIVQSRMKDGKDGIEHQERLLLAKTALGTAFEHLASRTIIALETLAARQEGISTLVVSGGVAANPFLKHLLRRMLDARGFSHVALQFPPPWLCTDNAAMIAWCGMEMFESGYSSTLNIGVLRKWSMDPSSEDGGIIGVGGWHREGPLT